MKETSRYGCIVKQPRVGTYGPNIKTEPAMRTDISVQNKNKNKNKNKNIKLLMFLFFTFNLYILYFYIYYYQVYQYMCSSNITPPIH